MVDFDLGVVFGGIVLRFWGSLNDGVKGERRGYLDEGDMEDLCAHAIRELVIYDQRQL